MVVSVGGNSVCMEKARKQYGDFMSALQQNGVVDYDLVGSLVKLGLRVEITKAYVKVVYEEGCGPYCKLPEVYEEDEWDETDDGDEDD